MFGIPTIVGDIQNLRNLIRGELTNLRPSLGGVVA